MDFNKHSNLEGLHAFLSPSSVSWLNYNSEKLITTYNNMQAKEKGTEDHEFAATCIKRRQKIYKTNDNLANYINDSVSMRMSPEVVLYFSDYCFGTADAISFEKGELRINDLKTGATPAKMEQLEIYAALFCLEYKQDPASIFIELRIYQYGEVFVYNPEPQRILEVMNIIKAHDRILTSYIQEIEKYE